MVLRSTGPVLDFEPSHAFELPFIVRNEDHVGRLGMCGNPKIIGTDNFALELQRRLNDAVSTCGLRRQGQDLHQTGKLVQFPERSRAGRTFLGSVAQFTQRYDRKSRLAHLQSTKSVHDLRWLTPPDVDANVRIEQKNGFHHSSSRDCGGSFRAFSTASISIERFARSSNARSMLRAFSRSTTSSPRRNISTSFPLN